MLLQAHVLSPRATIMPVMSFSPHTISQACWHCTHPEALVYRGSAARREIGADDEAGPPVSVDVACRLVAGERPMDLAWAP